MNRLQTVANGDLRVHFDNHGQVKSLFLPSSRPYSFSGESGHKIGVCIDGKTSWVEESGWTIRVRHAYNAPISSKVIVNESLGVLLELEDIVASGNNVLIRNIHVVNLNDQQRTINLFMHQSFKINSPNASDTAQFIPQDRAVLHYGSGSSFVVSGATDVGHRPDQHSVGLFGGGLDGTWRDADDGELSGEDIAVGQTDSTLRFSLTIGALSSRRVYYWLTSACHSAEAIKLQRSVTLSFLADEMENTVKWWRKWLSPTFQTSERLQPKYRQALSRSLSNIRLDQDQSGIVLQDQSIAISSMHDSTYAMWPLIRLGYETEPRRFFEFCRACIDERGLIMSTYDANAFAGPDPFPISIGNPPAKLSVTSIVLFVFSQFYAKHRQTDFLSENYNSLVIPLATSLLNSINHDNLPLATYDRPGKNMTVQTYEVAVVCAALSAGADMAELMLDQNSAVAWRNAADEMRISAAEALVDDGVVRDSLEESAPSATAFFGAFMFGLFDIDSDVIRATSAYLEQNYRRPDGLFRGSDESKNADYVFSLRMSQYYLEVGRKDEAHRIIRSVIDQSDDTELLSVVERAELASTLLDTINRA